MLITRHNYEEFFLLLADGELTPAQEEMVLAFTQQHPDLAEELDLMMECRLEAEVPPIFPKEKLLKPVIWNVEEPEAIQLQLLDLLDNELDAASKSALEKKIEESASLKLEWEILQSHAKLEAEAAPAFPKEKILKPTIWNVDEPDTIYVQMMALLDNELPATEKLELEQKIASSKALQIEWNSLQQTRLVPEVVSFPKAKILQPNLWNVEEPETVYVQMMALLDNELPAAEKLELEQKIAADSSLQTAWQSLQNTKLTAETIEFPNKQLLYREKEQRRIGGWIRWAAAAAVLLGFGWYLLPSKNVEPTNGMATNTVKEPATKTVVPAKNESVKTPVNTNETAPEKIEKTDTESTTTTDEASDKMATVTVEKNSKQNGIEKQAGTNKKAVTRTNEYAVNNEQNSNTNNSIASFTNTNNEEEQTFHSNRNVITGNTENEHETANRMPNQLKTVPANMQQNNNYAFRTASFTDEEELEEDAENDVVYIAGARLNKQKVRGVFRGITRSLGRTFTKSKVASVDESPSLSRSLNP
jgi:anti-sigma factor RsiW